MNKLLWTIPLVCIILTTVIISSILSFGSEKETPESVIGVIMPGRVNELGWNGIHYKGIAEAAENLGVKVLLVENARENSGLCAAAIDSLVEAGAKMVILGSYNYPQEVLSTIRKYPKVMFFSYLSMSDEENYKVYFARVYQARFLSGIVAGLSTKNNKIGYVAAMNNNEVNRGINAFALGVAKVNPEAKIFVSWTGAWDDEDIEKDNVNRLVNGAGVDLVAYHQNQDWVLKEAEVMGVMSIGYNLDSSYYSPNVLTSVSTNWEIVYKSIIQDYFQKKQSLSNYWIGIETDAVGLSFYSSLVSDSVKNVLNETVLQMKSGMDVFSGPIYDNKKKRRCAKDEIVSDQILRDSMDWFVKGVVIYED